MNNCRFPTAFYILLSVVLLATVGCAANSHSEARSPAQQFSNYQFDPASPLGSRIVAAPPFVVDYLKGPSKN